MMNINSSEPYFDSEKISRPMKPLSYCSGSLREFTYTPDRLELKLRKHSIFLSRFFLLCFIPPFFTALFSPAFYFICAWPISFIVLFASMNSPASISIDMTTALAIQVVRKQVPASNKKVESSDIIIINSYEINVVHKNNERTYLHTEFPLPEEALAFASDVAQRYKLDVINTLNLAS